MVSADNVNYDVLMLIFTFLGTNDLVSASLVSRSFKAGATPRLYRCLYFRLDQLKRWPMVSSPFSTILTHPGLGVHVRYCEIKAVPKLKGKPHPLFISTCAGSLALCCNLVSFTCTSDVPPFLPLLPKKARLSELKIHAALEAEQSTALTQVEGLQSIALSYASLNVCHVLPTWIPTLSKTLTSFTITNSRDFNEVVLKSLILSLPRLRGLHVVGCPKISHQSVLRLTSHTPLLESLSFTTWDKSSTSLTFTVSLPNLHYISIDTRCSLSINSVPLLYTSIFSALAACPLTSLTFKLSEPMIVGGLFIHQIVNNHCATLTRFNAVNVSISDESLELICTHCQSMEQLAMVIPMKTNLEIFPEILGTSHSLRTLIDTGDARPVHKPRATADDVRDVFLSVPYLRTIISGNRRWTCERIPIYAARDDYEDEDDWAKEPVDYHINLKLERLKRSNSNAQRLMEPPY